MQTSHSRSSGGDEEQIFPPQSLQQQSSYVTRTEQKSNHEDGIGMPPETMMIARKTKRKEEGPLALCCEWVAQHQIGLSVNLLLLLGLTHVCFPKARRHTRKFLELSYLNVETGEYTLGWDDACLVFHSIVLFTGVRAAMIDFAFMPLAQWAGVRSRKDIVRFAEQAWILIYYTIFWSLGMFIFYHSPYWLNLKAVWANWPNREIDSLLKWYILVQFAFWVQQIMVINIEKRRKDHWQMFTHHIITCLLIFTSYGYHQTKVANVILCLMDVVDIILPLAKCMKYLGFSTLCDVLFGIFMFAWVISRHILYLMVCYSVWNDIPIEIAYGCYKGKKSSLIGPFPAPDMFGHLIDPFRSPDGVVCFNHEIKWAFLTGLLFLQCIILMWFGMICVVAAKVLRGGQAEDTRSDDEDEEEYDGLESLVVEKMGPIEVVPLEEEVGVEAINLKGRKALVRRYKTSSSSSGVTLPGHSDRKELLGRIGCDKGV